MGKQTNDSKALRAAQIRPGQRLSNQLGNETVILNLENGVYYGLNETGARVWKILEAHSERAVGIAEIRDQIMACFDTDAEKCENDIRSLILDLKANGLVNAE